LSSSVTVLIGFETPDERKWKTNNLANLTCRREIRHISSCLGDQPMDDSSQIEPENPRNRWYQIRQGCQCPFSRLDKSE
jgi:hypothetical protein